MELSKIQESALKIFETAIGGISATDLQTEFFTQKKEVTDLVDMRALVGEMHRQGYIEESERISFSDGMMANEKTYGISFAGKVALRFRREVSAPAVAVLRRTQVGKPITVKSYAEAYFATEKRLPASVTGELEKLVNAGMAEATETGVKLTTFGQNVRKMLTSA